MITDLVIVAGDLFLFHFGLYIGYRIWGRKKCLR